MSTDFFGTKVCADKPTPYVPRPNDDNGTETLVLLNATIPANCKLAKGTRISLIVKTETCDSVALATLIVAQQDNSKMDIALDSYAEFSVMGPKGAEIHVTGHYLPKSSTEDDAEDGGIGKAIEGLIGAPSGYTGEDDEDDSDDDYEEEDDEDVAEIETPAALGKRKKPGVEITEVKAEPGESPGGHQGADESSDDDEDDDDKPKVANARKSVSEQEADSDEEDDEEDEDEEDDEDEESDDEMESDEEEADEEAAAKENGKPAQQTVAKDSKRSPGEPGGQPSQKRCGL